MKNSKQEGNEYDKIFKENIDKTIDNFIHNILKINIIKSETIVLKLQKTKEREANFLKIITNQNGEKFILHIEYQVANDSSMIHRMLDYCNLLIQKYNLRVEQYVVFLGEKELSMKRNLEYSNINFQYNLIDFKTINYNIFCNPMNQKK